MANLSTAFGTVTITAKDPNTLAQFLSLHLKSEERAYYDTTLNINGLDIKEVQQYVNENSYSSKPEPNYYSIDLTFSGTGRWSFISNINWFFSCLKNLDKHDHPLKRNDIDTFYLEIAQSLSKERLTANWHVTDSESGFDFILVYDIEITWNPEKQEQVILSETDEISTDYTAENLIEYDFYDQGEVWDIQYIRDNYDYFIECLKQENTNFSIDYKIIVENILAQPDKFKEFINKPDYNVSAVWYDISEILLDELELTSTSTF
jgi:hypothetical protein